MFPHDGPAGAAGASCRAVAVSGVALVGVFSLFVARPGERAGVSHARFRFSLREQLMVSWGRPARPPSRLSSQTYPLIAGVPAAKTIFNLVFFVVFISVLLQGTTIPRVVAVAAGRLAARENHFRYPIEVQPETADVKSELVEVPRCPRSRR